MLITFYGVRGSVPTPGASTARFGGNTSCMHVRLDDGTDLVFDAGTGIRVLGEQLAERETPIHLLLTHSHWDHIQGFPFFAPAYEPEREIWLTRGCASEDDRFDDVLTQMNGHNFPLRHEALPARVRHADDPVQLLGRRDFGLARKPLNHPGGGHAYRVETGGATLAFVTDNELDPPEQPATTYGEWVEFCRGADVLVHDAQYVEADMPAKHGWGHSLIHQVRELARDASVGHLVLYHHDPLRDDAELLRILETSERWFREAGAPTRCLCAWEGMTLSITDAGRGRRVEVNQARPAFR